LNISFFFFLLGIWTFILLIFYIIGFFIHKKKNKRNDLIVEEEDSLFGNEKLSLAQQFTILFPYKGIMKFLIHCIFSGVLLSYTCVFLSLDNLNNRFKNSAIKWILYIFDWIGR